MAFDVLNVRRMKRLLLTPLLALVACTTVERGGTGQCPGGETCSDLTPLGLEFIGNLLLDGWSASAPRPTAIGGTQTVVLEYDRSDRFGVELDLPYTADDDGGAGVRVESTSGSQVVIRGVAVGSNYLRILDSDGLLMDREKLTSAALERIDLEPRRGETIPADRQLAFSSGPNEIAIALHGDVQQPSGRVSERLIDTSMQLELAGAERRAWDVLRIDFAPGTYSVGVTAGDRPATALDLVIVDRADSLSVQANQPVTVPPNATTHVCFEALAAQRYVAGLTWTFDVDGSIEVHDDFVGNRNCVTVMTTKPTGTVKIQASAGGLSTGIMLDIVEASEN